MAFSVLATLHFIKLLNAEKLILVGYVNILSSVLLSPLFFSGIRQFSTTQVKHTSRSPECVAALIQVAPAIFATLTTPKVVKENQSGHDNQMIEDNNSIRNLVAMNRLTDLCSHQRLIKME
ncbi:hypothetical protein JHK85_011356 [Glycine max]|nr:hypothetical protein JHK85_011356 [Glycine max]KAG5067312.1 hypothetical protein JHK86_011043 [Glycine max]